VANVQKEGRVWQMFNRRDVVINVQQEGRGWQMFNRRDVGGKCLTGETCVANV